MWDGDRAVVTSSVVGPRNIPAAAEIPNVKKFIGKREIAATIAPLRELYGKYLFLENSLRGQLEKYRAQLPGVKEPLDAVEAMLKRKAEGAGEETRAYTRLTDTCFTETVIPPDTDTVYLWLGANTMCEYTLEEAKVQLAKTVSSVEEQIATLEKDIQFLRTQMTRTEVNLSRIQNAAASRAKALR